MIEMVQLAIYIFLIVIFIYCIGSHAFNVYLRKNLHDSDVIKKMEELLGPPVNQLSDSEYVKLYAVVEQMLEDNETAGLWKKQQIRESERPCRFE